jgi:mannose-6-phosphate isomerase-like protein (cupin superfamily)
MADDHGRPPDDAPPGPPPAFRARRGAGRWDGTELRAYKQDNAAPFCDVTRQVLFSDPAMAAEWRYFEIAAGGHTTLERHQHVHAVMVHRGRGQCLVGTEIRDIGPGDLVFIAAMTWHQFRATTPEPLGFLCLVNAERDRPQLPSSEDLAQLRRDPAVAAFIRC